MANSRRLLTALMRAALVLAVLRVPLSARACAEAMPPNTRVQVVDESAVIIWDPATHQEHFIRRATFNATANDFGFLVPTPAAPTLAAADDVAFTYLENLIRPRVITRRHKRYYLSSLLFPAPQTAAAEMKSAASLPAVRVLSTQHVAGYDAVVLAADTAGALLGWLRSHGYSARPELLAWLTPYVEARWKITAFKISKDNPRSSHTASSAVRMSFSAPRPFFPYREPADQREPRDHAPARSLRIFLLSAERMQGGLGPSGVPGAWPARVQSANHLPAEVRPLLEKHLSLAMPQLPDNLWLTTFEDRSSPRPGTDDVYFAPAPQQTVLEPPPVTVTREERVAIPVEPILLIAVLGGLGRALVRRTRVPKSSPQRSP